MKINLVADIFGTSGYAMHGRNLFQALQPLCEKIHLETYKPQNWQSMVTDAELHAITTPATADMVTICINIPTNWPFFYTDPCKAFYGFCVWEGTQIPLFWEQYLTDERVTGIFVPSTHVMEMIQKSIPKFKKPIYVIPHGANPLIFKPNSKGTGDKPLTFMAHKGWNLTKNDRGGIPKIVQAFTEEFAEDEPVELILKINPAYAQMNEDTLKNAFKDLALPEKRHKILINYRTVPDEELSNIYNDADYFISASYGEAFNIPVLEAMMCGCTPIVPTVGGHNDFVGIQGMHMNGTTCKPFDIVYEDCEWCDIPISEIRLSMRVAFDAGKQNRQAISDSVHEYSWFNTAKKIEAIITCL